MRPLSFFVDTEFSQAVAGEYGEYLQALKADVQWLAAMAATIDNYNLALDMHTNSSLSSYTMGQRILFRIGLDIYDGKADNLNRFREILQEYA